MRLRRLSAAGLALTLGGAPGVAHAQAGAPAGTAAGAAPSPPPDSSAEPSAGTTDTAGAGAATTPVVDSTAPAAPPAMVQEPPPPGTTLEEPPPPAAEPPQGDRARTGRKPRSLPRTHDGFYARFSAGPGLFLARSGTLPDQRHFSGGAAQFQVLLGGAVSRYVTLGGSYEHARVIGLASHDDIVNGNEPNLSGTRFTVIALTGFMDVYPEPTRGLHFMGQFGPGALSTNRRAADPTGWLFALGGGYDWFVADEWSLGVMARLAYGMYSVVETSAGSVTTVDVLVPSIVASGTYD